MPTNTVLIPGAGIDWANEVLLKKNYIRKFQAINYGHDYYKGNISISLYPEYSPESIKVYNLIRKLKVVEEPGILLQFTEFTLEEAFSEGGVLEIGALVRSISPNKKYSANIDDILTPIIFDEPLHKIIQKGELTKEDLAKILNTPSISI